MRSVNFVASGLAGSIGTLKLAHCVFGTSGQGAHRSAAGVGSAADDCCALPCGPFEHADNAIESATTILARSVDKRPMLSTKTQQFSVFSATSCHRGGKLIEPLHAVLDAIIDHIESLVRA
jgi:hypothetical protein